MNISEEDALWHALTCSGGNWLPTNHLLFHLANICLFLTYTTPPGLVGVLFDVCAVCREKRTEMLNVPVLPQRSDHSLLDLNIAAIVN